MTQIMHGVRAILSRPVIYSCFQCLMGGHRGRTTFVKDFIRPFPGMTVLDIGCGPADILRYLRDVDYFGFDINDAYIHRARALYGQRAKFESRELVEADVEKMPLFDAVLAQGLIHHLDDEAAIRMMKLAYKALKPEGRFLTVDPCLDFGQDPIARFLVSYDRGQHVRNKTGYTSLAQLVFKSARIEIRHQSWIPYTHCYMECTRL